MHARELIELAALIATRSEMIAREMHEISVASLQRYWIASKCRFDRWSRTLKQYSSPAEPMAISWERASREIEEILMCEVLTRVWTAVGTVHDRRQESNNVEPVLRSVLNGHLEARNRALNLMIYGQGFDAKDSVDLNRLRRRMESLTDMLLAQLADSSMVTDLCFDAHRLRDLADMKDSQPQYEDSWLAAITALLQGTSRVGPNDDLNQQIVTSILGCLPEDIFDSSGLFQSLWLLRLSQTTSDAQGLITDLLALH